MAPRDEFIGWNAKRRTLRLGGIAKNGWYLVLSWSEVLKLASYILGLLARRNCTDWISKYGPPLHSTGGLPLAEPVSRDLPAIGQRTGSSAA